jgi:hypothetical protein
MSITNRGKRYTKYSVDTGFFECVDTEAKAYWLGFILADGCVKTSGNRSIRPNQLTITLASVDENHLHKLKSDLGSNNPIKQNDVRLGEKVYKASTLSVYSVDLIQPLLCYGIVPRKSYSSTLNISSIPRGLHRHFWRGVIDGDGTLGAVFRRNVYEFSLRCIGTLDTVTRFMIWCSTIVDVGNNGISNLGNSLRQTKICSRKVLRPILDELYQDSTVFLQRKKDRYDYMTTLMDAKESNPKLRWSEVRNQYDKYTSTDK